MSALTIVQRTVSGYLVLVLLIAALGGSSLFVMSSLSQSLTASYQEVLPTVNRANALKEPAYAALTAMSDYLRVSSDPARQEAQQMMQSQQQELAHGLASLEAELPDILQGSMNFASLQQGQKQLGQMFENQLTLHDRQAELEQQIQVSFLGFSEGWRGFNTGMQTLGNRVTDPALARQVRAFERAGAPLLETLNQLLMAANLDDFELPKTNALGALEGFDRPLAFVEERDAGLYGELLAFRNRAEPRLIGEASIVEMKQQQLETRAQLEQDRQLLDQAFANFIDSLDVLLVPVADYAESQQQQAAGTVRQSLVLVVSLILGAVLLATVIGLSTVSSIRGPVRRMLAAIERIAQGDFSQPVAVQGKDELAQIGQFINGLIERLSSSISGVAATAKELQQAAMDNRKLALQTLEGTEQQREQTDSIATAIHQMESAVAEVAHSTESAHQQVELLREAADTNRQNMGASLTAIATLSENIKNAGEVISQVRQRSEDITGILSVIQGVSEQTNLLALNAAIEAARAGEQGRGFAVVADEVRSLATKTRDSAQEIHSMIDALVNASAQAVQLMSNAEHHVTDVVEQSNLTNTSLQQMTQNLEEVADRSVQIAAAAVEQSEVAKEVNRNILGIAGLAQQAALGAQQSSTNSEEVNRLAEEQAKLIAIFKY